MATISDLPPEMVREILQYLQDSDALNAALVCDVWRWLSNPLSEELVDLKLTFNSRCENTVEMVENRVLVHLCTCEEHLYEQCARIKAMLGMRGIDRIRNVQIADEIPKPNEGIPDVAMNVVVHRMNKDVNTVNFTDLDLSFVNFVTFAKLARFRHINTLIFVDCTFPSDMNQGLFIRNMAPMLPTVESLEMTGTPFVNDEFGFALAKYGFSLHYVSLERCQNISAITIASFCTRAGSDNRERPVVFNLHSTRFNVEELHRILRHPTVRKDKPWNVQLSDLRHLNGRFTVNLSTPQDNGYTVFY
uniref:F-box domain-containing protein n=1 Tax=Panagrellus redivivus TaxID=6233 RepID=A0A7E4UX42_PANRE